MLLVQGILLALLARAQTGRGQEVYTSLLDAMLATQIQEATFLLNTGRMLNWGYLPLGNPFPTRDGYIAVVGAFRPNPLADILSFTEKKIEVECDDGSSRQFETMRVFLGIVFNSPYFNKGLYFDKQISPSDGILHAVMVPLQNRWRLLFRFMAGRMGFSLAHPRDRKVEGRMIRIESNEPLYPQVDGEPAGKEGYKILQFSVLEKGLNLLMPKGAH